MHEKDIELARLLIARETELHDRSAALRSELNAVRAKVDDAKAQSQQRDAYADILAKAADLLQRTDLTVDAPDTSADEQRLGELEGQVAELDAQDQQYQELINALKERAPQLFDAATGALLEAPGEAADGNASSPAESETDAASEFAPEAPVEDVAETSALIEDELELPASAPEAEPEFEAEPEDIPATIEDEVLTSPESEQLPQPDESAEALEVESIRVNEPVAAAAQTEPQVSASAGTDEDWDESVKLYVAGRGGAPERAAEDDGPVWTGPNLMEEPAPASLPDEPLTEDELDRFLQRFNMEKIQKETLEVLGGEAAYVIDAASVLDNIPYYDREIRGGPVRFIREELLRDIDLLSRHIKGPVYLVLDQPYETDQKVGSRVALRNLSGADKGQREAAEALFKQVLAEATKGGTAVCFVTGDLGLGGSMRSRRVHFFPLSDFFRT